MASVMVGGQEREVQRLVLVKALRAITLLNRIQNLVPAGAEQLGEFVSSYRAAHVEELDRVQAKLRFGGEIPVIEDGKPIYKPDGQVLTVRAPIDLLTEEDWARAKQVYRRPEDPPLSAMVAAIFPTVAETAEEPLLRLLAVCIIDNDDFRKYVKDGNWEEKADAVVRDVLEGAYLEEIIDLMVAVGDMLEGSVLDKMSEVAEKAGKLLARIGITLPGRAQVTDSPTSSESPEDLSSSGSTPSASDTQDGGQTTSSDSPGTTQSDSPSVGGSSETRQTSSEPAQSVPA